MAHATPRGRSESPLPVPSPPVPPLLWSPDLGVDAVVRKCLSRGSVTGCLASQRELPARDAEHAALPPGLDPRIVAALERRGIRELYTHQRRAIDAAREGKNVLTATPTASGKSLCLHLPVLDALARDPSGSALYLYPTKA